VIWKITKKNDVSTTYTIGVWIIRLTTNSFRSSCCSCWRYQISSTKFVIKVTDSCCCFDSIWNDQTVITDLCVNYPHGTVATAFSILIITKSKTIEQPFYINIWIINSYIVSFIDAHCCACQKKGNCKIDFWVTERTMTYLRLKSQWMQLPMMCWCTFWV